MRPCTATLSPCAVALTLACVFASAASIGCAVNFQKSADSVIAEGKVDGRDLRGTDVRRLLPRFSGNMALSEAALKQAIERPNELATAEGRERGRQNLEAAYYDHGYLDVSILSPLLIGPTSDGTVEIEYRILREGNPYRIGEFKLTGNPLWDSLSTSEVLLELHSRPGMVLNRSLLRDDLLLLNDKHWQAGYLCCDVNLITRMRGDTVDIEVAIEKGSPAKLGSIKVSGLARLDERTIREVLSFREGSSISVHDFQVAEAHVSAIAGVRGVSVLRKCNSRTSLQIEIQVTEAK